MKVVRGFIGWPMLVLGGLLFLIMGWRAVGNLFKYGFTLPPGGNGSGSFVDALANVQRGNVTGSYIGTCLGFVVAFVGYLIIDKR